jgi:hypothetical protein
MFTNRNVVAFTVGLVVTVLFGFSVGCPSGYSGWWSADPSASFGAFYTFKTGIGIWGWSLIIGFAVAAGVVAYFTAGTATPWMVSVGSWIGGWFGLSGAASTSFGLALLGGGALKAGGLGIAGGVAVLSASAAFSTAIIVDVPVSYGVEYLLTQKKKGDFTKDSVDMLTLPIPTNQKGHNLYLQSLNKLVADIDLTEGQQMASKKNLKVLNDTIKYVTNDLLILPTNRDRLKVQTLLALLHFLAGDYVSAHEASNEALTMCRMESITDMGTLPSYLYVISYLYTGDISGLKQKQTDYFKYAILREPDNPLMPLLFAIYLDRVMYLYHNINVNNNNVNVDSDIIAQIIEIVASPEIKKFAPYTVTILTARLLLELKQTQQDILIVTGREDTYDDKHADMVKVLHLRYRQHKEMLQLVSLPIKELLHKYDTSLPKDSPYLFTKINKLTFEYSNASPDLLKAIEKFEKK